MKNKNRKIYPIYSGLFLLISSLITIYLIANGKTNINVTTDGLEQHYRTLLYYSRYLKQIVKDLFTQGKLIMPHWDFTIGEGADMISALHAHGVGDPLTVLSVLVPERFMPVFYLLNTFIRMWLGGIFFIGLCLYTGRNDSYAIIAGSLTYSFCFWALEAFTQHIYFLTPLMIMPLYILGLEKIFSDDEPFTFITAVCWGALSFFYYFYMEALGTAIYGIVRAFTKYGKDIKTVICKLLKVLIHAVLGVAAAAIILCPMIYTYLSDTRMGIEYQVTPFFPPFFYERLLTIFVSNDFPYDLHMGFAAPAFIAFLLSFKNFKKNKCLALLNLLTFIIACLPFFCMIFNGFSFVSERWSFMIALTVSYTLVFEWSEIGKDRRISLILWLFMLGLAAYSAWSRTERVFVPVGLCLVFILIAVSKISDKIFKADLKQVLLIGVVIVNILYLEEYNLSPRGGDIINTLLTIEKAKEVPRSTEAYTMSRYYAKNEDEFYRYTGFRLTNNTAMIFKVPSTDYYWSITNPSDQIFRLDLGLQDLVCWQIYGYDERAELESLANVKYFIARPSYDGLLPLGFELVKTMDNYDIYENKYVLPFGYTYKDSLSYEKWDELDPLQKQQAMMKQVVIENGSSVLKEQKIRELDYTVETSDGISFEEGTIIVDDKDASLTLHIDGQNKQELYLLVSGLEHEDIYKIIENDSTISMITLEASSGFTRYQGYMTNSHHYYFGKSDYAFYFGSEPIDTITLHFSLPGKYTFKDIRFCDESLDDFADEVNELSTYHLENVEFGPDTVKGTIDLQDERYLLLSIPYSNGWKAHVDGKESEILQANQHYLALKLDSGNHDIELRYSTPGLDLGSLISAVSLVGIAAYTYFYNKKRKRIV